MDLADIQSRRILCIDGGGLRGTFPAAFLAEMENHLPHPIGSYFDLIAGTSTGGILALGLGMGLKASAIVALYEKKGPKIFDQLHGSALNFIMRKIRAGRWLVQRKYSPENLKSALADPEVLGNKLLGESRTRLVIPAWNPDLQKVYIFKTAHHERLRTDYKSSAVDVALATAAAPSYFQQHVTGNDVSVLDGGIWANNPIAIAAVEAITLLGWPAKHLNIMSLGCLENIYSIPKNGGLGQLSLKIADLFMSGQSHGAMGMAKLLTGHEHQRQTIFRITDKIQNEYKLDDAGRIRELKGRGFARAREEFPKLENIFFKARAESFEPVYKSDRSVT
jgi:uncharacterized protein